MYVFYSVFQNFSLEFHSRGVERMTKMNDSSPTVAIYRDPKGKGPKKNKGYSCVVKNDAKTVF